MKLWDLVVLLVWFLVRTPLAVSRYGEGIMAERAHGKMGGAVMLFITTHSWENSQGSHHNYANLSRSVWPPACWRFLSPPGIAVRRPTPPRCEPLGSWLCSCHSRHLCGLASDRLTTFFIAVLTVQLYKWAKTDKLCHVLQSVKSWTQMWGQIPLMPKPSFSCCTP